MHQRQLAIHRRPSARPARLAAPQRGAALVVGLVLLLVMTLLGVTGISSNTLDLVMAGNTQHSQDAFEAAESAIQAEVLRGPLEDIAVPRTTEDYQFAAGVTADTTTTYNSTQLPPPGYSLTEYRSDHYQIDSLGESARGARSNHLQGFYVVVPSGLGED
ncbi:MAG: PilX N-terminal domain-containing pilus assembly protein [Pseudomonadota bacterium]